MSKTAMQRLIDKAGFKQAAAARAVGLSVGTFSKAVALGQWPKVDAASYQQALRQLLIEHGMAAADIDRAMRALENKNAPHTPSKARAGRTPSTQKSKGDAAMLLRKQAFTQEARKAFGLTRDPFTDDVQDAADVFTSPDVRYVRESMWATARHGGMLAVVGESGAGKSTLRRDLIDRIRRESASMIVCEPYVLGMEENDERGRTLKAAAIAEAVIASVAPLEKPRRSAEARFRQLHHLLRESYRSGNRHVLVIEEAHGMPTATLKHLKRFFELEDGFKKLLSIILIGQTELRMKLSEQNAEVREVVQRIEIVELPALDNHLADYLAFKFKRVGLQLDQVMDAGAVDALREKLSIAKRGTRPNQRELHSLLYPLAVANVTTAAINLAASIGAPQVTAEIIKEV